MIVCFIMHEYNEVRIVEIISLVSSHQWSRLRLACLGLFLRPSKIVMASSTPVIWHKMHILRTMIIHIPMVRFSWCGAP